MTGTWIYLFFKCTSAPPSLRAHIMIIMITTLPAAIRVGFNALLRCDVEMHNNFDNIAEFVCHWRKHSSNDCGDIVQTPKSIKAKSLYSKINRHVKKIEQNNYNFWAIVEDERFPPIINKHNALIVLVKPSPRTQQINMSRVVSSCRNVHTQRASPDVVFSAPIIENVLPLECVLNRVLTDVWWCILSDFCSCTSFDLLRISWGMFQDKVPDAEKEVTFNNVCTGKNYIDSRRCFSCPMVK